MIPRLLRYLARRLDAWALALDPPCSVDNIDAFYQIVESHQAKRIRRDVAEARRSEMRSVK